MIAVEIPKILNYLTLAWNLNIQFSPNGYYDYFDDEIVDYNEKENIIMFSRIVGAPEKMNHVLLQAFQEVESKIKGWKLVFAGPLNDDFKGYIKDYLSQRPDLKDRVIFTGALEKKELNELYRKAKIFCLTSQSESVPQVLAEALSRGCYFVSSDVGGVYELIKYGQYGSVFPINDKDGLKNMLAVLCNDENKLRINCEKSQEYARDELNWINICSKINYYLNK